MHNLDFIILRLKSRFLSWLFWTLIWLSLSIVFALVFESFSKTAPQMEELYLNLPPAILDSFNIDAGYLSKAENFLAGQFLTLFTLLGAIFALYQGINEVVGKIEDGTMTNYLSKQISRDQFYTWQQITNVYFLTSSNFFIWLVLFLSFSIFTSQPDLSIIYFIWGFISTSFLFLTVSSIAQLAGVIFSKNIALFSGIGILIFSFFLNTLSKIEGYPNWLKGRSIFYYLNVEKLRDDFALDLPKLLLLLILFGLAFLAGRYLFRTKDI